MLVLWTPDSCLHLSILLVLFTEFQLFISLNPPILTIVADVATPRTIPSVGTVTHFLLSLSLTLIVMISPEIRTDHSKLGKSFFDTRLRVS